MFGIEFCDVALSDVLFEIKDYVFSDSFDPVIVVTPNVDHVYRLETDILDIFRDAYGASDVKICDSRILQKLSRFSSSSLNYVVPGSDLTKALLEEDWVSKIKICIIGCTETGVSLIKNAYGLLDVTHINPSMGFIKNLGLVEEYSSLAAESGASIIFVAVGSPQQEILAARIKEKLQGVSDKPVCIICVGASFDFLTGKTKRAPKWMRELSLEWLHRALSEPRRMVPRYWRNFVWICRVLIRYVLGKEV